MSERHYRVKFDFEPYKKQQMIMDYINGVKKNQDDEPYRFIIAVLGRQSGKSWLARVTLLDKAINEKKKCMWVSQSYVASRTHWQELLRLIEKSGIPVKNISQAAKEIHFYGGGQIAIRTALSPDSMRGGSLDYLVLDEAAFYENGAYVWYSVCLPMITASGGVVFIPTTPRGRNWVYDLYLLGQNPDEKYYKSFRWTSSESPYQDVKLLKDIKRNMPSKQWKEEFEAEFLSDAGGVFAGLDNAATSEFLTEPLPGHTYIMSVDVGNNIDDTCITILDKYERRQVYGESFNDLGTIPSVSRMIALMDLWCPEVTIVEKNGVGEHLLRLIKEMLTTRNNPELNKQWQQITTLPPDSELVGSHPIRSLHITNDIKRGMVERLSTDIEYGRFSILDTSTDYGRKQFAQMGTYEMKTTPSGLRTYGAAGLHHDDTVAALYLAYYVMPPFRVLPVARVTDGSETSKSPFRGGLGARHHRIKRWRGKNHAPSH